MRLGFCRINIIQVQKYFMLKYFLNLLKVFNLSIFKYFSLIQQSLTDFISYSKKTQQREKPYFMQLCTKYDNNSDLLKKKIDISVDICIGARNINAPIIGYCPKTAI